MIYKTEMIKPYNYIVCTCISTFFNREKSKEGKRCIIKHKAATTMTVNFLERTWYKTPIELSAYQKECVHFCHNQFTSPYYEIREKKNTAGNKILCANK